MRLEILSQLAQEAFSLPPLPTVSPYSFPDNLLSGTVFSFVSAAFVSSPA